MSRSIEDIREAFLAIHRYATGQSDRAHMSIPADPRRDADLIVSAAIDELAELRTERDRLREALGSVYQFHKRVECISEERSECSCQAFDVVRAALNPERES